MYHPSRGGVRGGSDQFEWESVKADKHRENYLGHSLMAPVGRWQKNKDLQWFSRDKKGSADKAKQEEKESIKRMEAEAMAAALGKGPVKKVQTQKLTRQELEEVFKKGQTERDDKDIERVEGMGFGSNRASLMDTLTSNTKETLSATGSDQDVPSSAKQKRGKPEVAPVSIVKEEKKETKIHKKKVKKDKHKHKKKKSKVHSRRRRHDSESDSEDQTSSRKRQAHNSNTSDDSQDESLMYENNQLRKHHKRVSCNSSDNLSRKTKHRRHDSDDNDYPIKTKRQYERGEAKYSSQRHDSDDDNNDHPRKNKSRNLRKENKHSSRRHGSVDDHNFPRKKELKNEIRKGKESRKQYESSSDEHSRQTYSRHSVRKRVQTGRHDSLSEDDRSHRETYKKDSSRKK